MLEKSRCQFALGWLRLVLIFCIARHVWRRLLGPLPILPTRMRRSHVARFVCLVGILDNSLDLRTKHQLPAQDSVSCGAFAAYLEETLQPPDLEDSFSD